MTEAALLLLDGGLWSLSLHLGEGSFQQPAESLCAIAGEECGFDPAPSPRQLEPPTTHERSSAAAGGGHAAGAASSPLHLLHHSPGINKPRHPDPISSSLSASTASTMHRSRSHLPTARRDDQQLGGHETHPTTFPEPPPTTTRRRGGSSGGGPTMPSAAVPMFICLLATVSSPPATSAAAHGSKRRNKARARFQSARREHEPDSHGNATKRRATPPASHCPDVTSEVLPVRAAMVIMNPVTVSTLASHDANRADGSRQQPGAHDANRADGSLQQPGAPMPMPNVGDNDVTFLMGGDPDGEIELDLWGSAQAEEAHTMADFVNVSVCDVDVDAERGVGVGACVGGDSEMDVFSHSDSDLFVCMSADPAEPDALDREVAVLPGPLDAGNVLPLHSNDYNVDVVPLDSGTHDACGVVVAPGAALVAPAAVIPIYSLPESVVDILPMQTTDDFSLEKVSANDSKCGAYFACEFGEDVGVFKPFDQECVDPDTGDFLDCGEWSALRSGVVVGDAFKKEIAAYRLDHLNLAGVPETDMRLIPASKMPKTKVVQLQQQTTQTGAGHDHSEPDPDSTFKLGSYQKIVSNQGNAGEFGPRNYVTEDVHKVALLDMRLFNMDRTAQNLLVKRGGKRLVPIDHGLCLPDFRTLGEASFVWLQWEQSKSPLSADLCAYVRALDARADATILRELAIPEASILTYVLATEFLKAGVEAGLTPYDIGSAMCRENAFGGAALSNGEHNSTTAAAVNSDSSTNTTNNVTGSLFEALVAEASPYGSPEYLPFDPLLPCEYSQHEFLARFAYLARLVCREMATALTSAAASHNTNKNTPTVCNASPPSTFAAPNRHIVHDNALPPTTTQRSSKIENLLHTNKQQALKNGSGALTTSDRLLEQDRAEIVRQTSHNMYARMA